MTHLIPRPGKIVAVGLNYRDHAAEAGVEIPATPLVFAKFSSSVIGDGDSIVLPPGCDQVDFEAELGVVIGRRASRVSISEALDYVQGFTAINDVSDRAAQFQDGQFVRAKSYDTFTPVGPRVASSLEIKDPQRLAIQCRLNGEVVQESSTSDMIFPVAELIAYLSENITLEPGDLIATGTPAGVGYFRSPQVFLRPGDTVTVEIEHIGALSNPVVLRESACGH